MSSVSALLKKELSEGISGQENFEPLVEKPSASRKGFIAVVRASLSCEKGELWVRLKWRLPERNNPSGSNLYRFRTVGRKLRRWTILKKLCGSQDNQTREDRSTLLRERTALSPSRERRNSPTEELQEVKKLVPWPDPIQRLMTEFLNEKHTPKLHKTLKVFVKNEIETSVSENRPETQ